MVKRRMDPTAHRALLAASALTLSSCTALFDPSQYWTDGGVDTADAFVPPGVDASLDALVPPTDAWAPDAYVPPDIDADLDAHRVEAPDAAEVDAFSPVDAGPPMCPSDTSLALPTCLERGNGLAYCHPVTHETRSLSSATAAEVLPGARHELGLLGNGILVGEAGAGEIDDFDLAREDDRVVAVWLNGTNRVQRREYVVGMTGLTEGSGEDASFGTTGSTGTELSLRPGHVDELAIGYVDGGAPMYGLCGATAFMGRGCTAQPSPSAGTGVSRVLVAHADDAVIGAYTGMQSGTGDVGFFAERIVPAPARTFFYRLTAPYQQLRSTSGAFVYTAGGDGNDRIVYAETAASTSLGTSLPRLARNGVLNDYRLVRARVGSVTPTIEIDAAFVSRSETGEIDCGGGSCIAYGEGARERTVANTLPELRDWSYDIVADRYRVAALLAGDFSGTQVSVATWDLGAPSSLLEPVIVGSGRIGPDVGDGRAIRTVVVRTSSSLEVFVLTLVTYGTGGAARDRLYLSGFRLLACGL